MVDGRGHFVFGPFHYQIDMPTSNRGVRPRNASVMDSEGRSALHYSVRADDKEQVNELLVGPDLDVNQPDRMGLTPLHLAWGPRSAFRDSSVRRSMSIQAADISAFEPPRDPGHPRSDINVPGYR